MCIPGIQKPARLGIRRLCNVLGDTGCDGLLVGGEVAAGGFTYERGSIVGGEDGEKEAWPGSQQTRTGCEPSRSPWRRLPFLGSMSARRSSSPRAWRAGTRYLPDPGVPGAVRHLREIEDVQPRAATRDLVTRNPDGVLCGREPEKTTAAPCLPTNGGREVPNRGSHHSSLTLSLPNPYRLLPRKAPRFVTLTGVVAV